MALSNMRIEPRREITETLLGLGVVVSIVGLDYEAASWLYVIDKNPTIAGWMAILAAAAVALFFASIIASVVIHALGESVCDALAKRGFDPRPKQRYVISAYFPGKVVRKEEQYGRV